MPFHEIMRLSLLGNHERLSAQRAFDIGLVSEMVPAAELAAAAEWAANAIASSPPLAIQGTVRAIWAGLEHTRQQAIELGYAFIAMGTNSESIAEGQRFFASGKRIEWKLR
jgi:enoyl-CoA hydratase/carnithine racemase